MHTWVLCEFLLCGCVMKNQPVRWCKRIETLRVPAVIPDDIYDMLQRSLMDILKMRRSIERAEARIGASRAAVLKSREMLERLRDEGF